MRPALEETKLLEDYINGHLDEERQLEMEICLLWDQELKSKLYLQRQAYRALREVGRQQLRQQLRAIHTRLFG